MSGGIRSGDPAMPGASIRYTTDGSTPSNTVGTVYSGPVTVTSTQTIKAIAYKTAMLNSPVATATYTINLPVVATPTFSPATGTYTSIQNVTHQHGYFRRLDPLYH